MRGRRRGRNKSSSQDVTDPTDRDGETPGAGAVTLVETPPPQAVESPAQPSEPSPNPASIPVGKPRSPIASPTASMKDTISDVATAHAELDNVLPPSGADASRSAAASPVQADDVVTEGPPEQVADEVVANIMAEVAPVKSEAPVVEAEPTLTTVADLALPAPVAAASIPVEPPAVVADEPPREPQSASGNPLPRVLAVANQKGGVGKTTTSVNLGAALAEIGFRVLVIDLDPQGNATTGLGIDARTFELSMYDVLMRDASLEDCVEPTSMKNLFVAPATIALAGAEIELVPTFSRELKLKRSIESVIDDFDYVLIDCPPSLGLITVNALAAADEVLVPIQCEYYALEGLSQLMRNVHLVASNLNPKLDISTIVLTMYDARTKLADQVANEVRLHFGAKVCRSVIPRTVRLSEAPSFGQPITAFDPTSRGAIAYRELAKEVSGGTS